MKDKTIDSLAFLFIMVAMLIFSSYSSEGSSISKVCDKTYVLNKIWLLGTSCPWIYVAVAGYSKKY